ncbi:MAG: hypothetical protein AAGA58_05510 [Verrucomicrobiota bacterium]
MNAHTDIDSLIARYFEGSAGKSESAKLADLLTNDPEVAARFAVVSRTEHALAHHFESEAAAAVARRELAETIAESERREERIAAKATKGETVAAHYRKVIQPVLRAAAALALLALATYALWPDAPSPTITETPAATPTERKNIPSGEPVRLTHNALSKRDRLKQELASFHLPQIEIQSDSLTGAMDLLITHYESVAAEHGENVASLSQFHVAPGVDAAAPIHLSLRASVPVSTALTALTIQADARPRFTGEGVILEPHVVTNPDEIISRQFAMSESTFRQLSQAASTEWSEAEEGISWDASQVLQTFGIHLDTDHEQARFDPSQQKLAVTSTRRNAASIDALRRAADATSQTQIHLTTKLVQIPLDQENGDITQHLPTLVQTESLLSDPEYQAIMRSLSQTSGVDIMTMPAAVGRGGEEISVSAEESTDDSRSIAGVSLESISQNAEKLALNASRVFVYPTESDENGNAPTPTRTYEFSVPAADTEGKQISVITRFTEADGETSEVILGGLARFEDDGLEISGEDLPTMHLITVEPLIQGEGETPENQTQQLYWNLEADRASLEKQLSQGQASLQALEKKNTTAEQELADELKFTWQMDGAQMLRGYNHQTCTQCHNDDVDAGDFKLGVDFGWIKEQADVCPFSQTSQFTWPEPSFTTPSINVRTTFEGHRIRVEGEVRIPKAHPPGNLNAGSQWNFDATQAPTNQIQFPQLGKLPQLGSLFQPTDNRDSVIFDAVLAQGEVLMLEAARTENTRTLLFLSAKKTR